MFPVIAIAALALNALVLLWNCVPGVAHDNIYFHVPRFSYISHSLYHQWGLPRWYPFSANVPLFIDFISTFPFVPHRWVGYGLLYLTRDVLLAYRLMLLTGLGFAAWGWWLFLRAYFQDKTTAWFGTLLFCLGGSGITIFHQEQSLVLFSAVPWFLFCLLQLKRNGWWAAPLLMLLGLFTNTHYPHIFMVALGMFLGVRLVFDLPGTKQTVHTASPGAIVMGLALAALAASPTYFLVRDVGQFVTVVRDSVKADSLSQYLTLMDAPAGPHALIHAVVPFYGWAEDHYALFLGWIGLFFAIYAVRRERSRVLPYAVLALLITWAFLGKDAGLPQILFLLKIPMIGAFRQYTHFLSLLSLTLIFIACAGFQAWSRAQPAQRAAWVLGVLVFECTAHTLLYRNKFLDKKETSVRFPLLNTIEFTDAIHLHRSDANQGLGFISKPPLFRYRETQSLYQRCTLAQDDVYFSSAPLPVNQGCPLPLPAERARLQLNPLGFELQAPENDASYAHLPLPSQLEWQITTATKQLTPVKSAGGAVLSIPWEKGMGTIAGRVGQSAWPLYLLCLQSALLLAVFAVTLLLHRRKTS